MHTVFIKKGTTINLTFCVYYVCMWKSGVEVGSIALYSYNMFI